MGTYSFFGHRDTPASIRPILKCIIIDLLQKDSDCEFLVGNQGAFDALVKSVLKELQKEGYDFSFYIVIPYLPTKKNPQDDISQEPLLFPEGLETVPKRFAISKRNRWMVDVSDSVICYIRHWQGGAASAVEYAQRKKKTVINLADDL